MRPFLIQVTEYEIDLVNMWQKNMTSGMLRSIRAVEIQYEGDGSPPPAPSQEEAPPTPAPPTPAGASEASGAQPAAAAAAGGPCYSS